jgi:hypothetical protein
MGNNLHTTLNLSFSSKYPPLEGLNNRRAMPKVVGNSNLHAKGGKGQCLWIKLLSFETLNNDLWVPGS